MMALGYILLFGSNTLSSSAGVGGGLLNVAIIHSVQGYDIKSSVVLSLSAIMGNTLLQMLINSRTRHPTKKERSAIYWDVIAVMLPAELAGSNLGVILSDIMPSTILYIGAIIVLMIGGMFSTKKAMHLYELENERMLKKGKQSATNGSVENPISAGNTTAAAVIEDGQPKEWFGESLSIDHSHFQRSLSGAGSVDITEDSIVDISAPLPPLELPWSVIGVVAAVWLLYLVLYVVMTQVPGCSSSWGATLSFIYIILIIVAPLLFRFLEQQQAEYPETIVAGDIHWGPSAYVIPVVTFSIGLLTALLGFGGGELIGPYLLHLQIQPLVSTATSGMISFLNTTLSLIHYAILGKVHFGRSAILFCLGMVAGFCGRMCSLFVVAKFDRASILVFALVLVLGFSWVIYILYIATGKVSFELGQLCG